MSRKLDRLPPYVLPAIVFVAAAAAVFLRHRDVFLVPQFYAEDGTLWFARAHNIGAWRAVFMPDSGYFQIVSTLTAALSTAVPLRYAPLVFSLVAAAIETLPAVFLASRRAARLIPDTSLRLLLVALYVALPNTWTNCAVITYSHWRLALVAFLVMLAPPKSTREAVFDTAIVLLAGLGGPLMLLLAPVALLHCYLKPEERSWRFTGLVLATSAIQAACLVVSGATRSAAPLGASVTAFFGIFSNQVVLGVLLGQSEYSRFVEAWPGVAAAPTVILIGLAGIAVLGYAVARGPYALRLFVGYATIVFAATLFSASVSGTSQWEALTHPGAGTRYFLFAMLAFVAAMVWMAGQARLPVRAVGVTLLAAMVVFGIVHDWKHPRLVDYDYPKYVEEYENAPVGTSVEIPINPPGWKIVLVKR